MAARQNKARQGRARGEGSASPGRAAGRDDSAPGFERAIRLEDSSHQGRSDGDAIRSDRAIAPRDGLIRAQDAGAGRLCAGVLQHKAEQCRMNRGTCRQV